MIAQLPSLNVTALAAYIFGHNQPSLGLFKKFGFNQWGWLPAVAELGQHVVELVLVAFRRRELVGRSVVHIKVNHVVEESKNAFEDIVWNKDGDEGLVAEFVDVVRTGKYPNASGLDGAKALEVAEAAYRSVKSHKNEKVIHIEEI